jgi:hypothetical protein
MLVRLFGIPWRYAAPCDSETHMLMVGQYDDWRYFVPARPTFYARKINRVLNPTYYLKVGLRAQKKTEFPRVKKDEPVVDKARQSQFLADNEHVGRGAP